MDSLCDTDLEKYGSCLMLCYILAFVSLEYNSKDNQKTQSFKFRNIFITTLHVIKITTYLQQINKLHEMKDWNAIQHKAFAPTMLTAYHMLLWDGVQR